MGKKSQIEFDTLISTVTSFINDPSRKEIELRFTKENVRDYFLKKDINARFSVEGLEKQKIDILATKITKTNKFSKFMAKKSKETKAIEVKVQAQQEEQKLKEKHIKEDRKIKELAEEMGFSKVIEAILKARKPIIGHNFIYDLGFLYSQFIDDLPETYELFKKRISECFPAIYDTKIIVRDYESKFVNRDLIHVTRECAKLNQIIKFVIPEGFKNYEVSKEEHNAGYDSYCAGMAFAILTKYISIGVLKPGSHGIMTHLVAENKSGGGVKKVAHAEAVGPIDNKKPDEKTALPQDKEEMKKKIDELMNKFHFGPAAQKK